MTTLRNAPTTLLSVVGVGVLLPACSFLFVQPLAVNPSHADVLSCTTNQTAPVIDTLFVGTNLASVLYVAGQENVTNKGSSVALGLAVASLWALSAGYGYSWTKECKEAQEVGLYIPRPGPAGYTPKPVPRQQPVPPASNSIDGMPAYPPAAPAPPVMAPAPQTPSVQGPLPPVAAPPAAPPAPPPPARQLRDDDEPL